MGIPILAGRDFDQRDVRENSHVALINEEFAHHFFGRRDPIGRHLGRGGPGSKLDTEIIGVVANSLYEGPRQGIRRQVFVPNWGNGSVAFYARTGLWSSAAYAEIKRRKTPRSSPATLPDEDARAPVGRELAYRTANRHAVGRFWAAGHLGGRNRAVRSNGFRCCAANQRNGRADGTRGKSELSDLAHHERGAAPAGDRIGGGCSDCIWSGSLCCVWAVRNQGARSRHCHGKYDGAYRSGDCRWIDSCLPG